MTSEQGDEKRPVEQSAPEQAPRPNRTAFAVAVRICVGGATLTGAVSLLASLFAQRPLGVEGAQAVLVEWGATQLGAEWSAPPAPARAIVVRVGQGFAGGLAAGGLVLVLARLTGAVTSIAPVATAFGFGLAILHAVATAVRDELLVHGILVGLVGRRSTALCLLGGGLASAAWAFGTAAGETIPISALVAEALAGAGFTSLWLLERGAWRACSAHAAWLLATGSAVLSRATDGAWGGSGLLRGWAAVVGILPTVASLVVVLRRKQETSAPAAAVG